MAAFFLGKDKLPGYIGNVLVGSIVFTGYDFADDAQGLLDSLGRGDVMGVAVPVDEEAAFVSTLGSAVGEHCRYFRRIVQFGDAGRGGGVVHGAADVHRQNDGLFPFLPETADKREFILAVTFQSMKRGSSPGMYSRKSSKSSPCPRKPDWYCPAKFSVARCLARSSMRRTRLRMSEALSMK